MTSDEILSRLIQYFDQHLEGLRGSIWQKSYKDDFFELFKVAHESDYFSVRSSRRLTGDAIRDTLETRWIMELGEKEQDAAKALLEDFICMWNEWRYAWDKL